MDHEALLGIEVLSVNVQVLNIYRQQDIEININVSQYVHEWVRVCTRNISQFCLLTEQSSNVHTYGQDLAL